MEKKIIELLTFNNDVQNFNNIKKFNKKEKNAQRYLGSTTHKRRL